MERKKKGIPRKKTQKKTQVEPKAPNSVFELPDDAKSLEMAFVGLLPGKDGLYYTLTGKAHLGKGIMLTCEHSKADLIEFGLARAEVYLENENTG